MDNTILNQGALPNFSPLLPEQIEPTLKLIISQNKITLNELLAKGPPFTWENLSLPLEELSDKLSKFWAPISHLHSVAETDALRNAYNNCLPLLSNYSTGLLQNELLFGAIQSIADSPSYRSFTPPQHKIIENDLRDFKLAGVVLPPTEKIHFAELQKQLSTLTTKFSENLLDATHAWTFHVTDIHALKGLSDQTLQLLAQNAEQNEKEGWIITLDYPCYSMVMKYLDNRELRWLLYEAYVTRASDQGPHAGRYDNSPLMENILKIRSELAKLLGFKHFVDYSLATKMADNSKDVLDFLNALASKAKKFAAHEIKELQEFAKNTDGLAQLEAWDLPYYSEKLRGSKYALHQEEVKDYFPIQKVLEGMFETVNKLFGLKITERLGVDTWHPQIQFFDIYDENNNLRGSLYIDLYARAHKREGAWMDECRVRRQLMDGTLQLPVAFLTCNFNRPIGNRPALLTHDDVTTLFHEFGHCLHHLLTQMIYAGVSGINGVPWDAVEVPSQFLEHWCWEPETLRLISEHVVTGESLPDSLYQKLIAAKNFQAGLHLLRQLEFAIFDFRLHLENTPPTTARIQELLEEIRNNLAVFKTPPFNRFQHSFSHIFAGGYAAGYYSYLWAEVLSSDAYSKFEETGIFNRETGQAFLQTILEQGGSIHPMELFVTFRGRKPTIDALLRHHGIAEEN
jgi:oligopeptidase A